ncbi:MAG: ribosomal protein S18-alanine N-acetyltransferase [Candidatus Aminicenantes bacterium]|nr:ribosomal protein S18-alanine N-acetyltransferase [Candidatus Aminicenantes bacterium]
MKEKDIFDVCAIEEVSFSTPWHFMTFLGEIQNESVSFPFVVIHREEERIAGYVIYWRIQKEIQISNIAVHPDFRRQGLAKAVLQEILKMVEREEARFVSLEVRPSNKAACSLYTKLGFHVIGLRKKYYRNPAEDALIMGKKL